MPKTDEFKLQYFFAQLLKLACRYADPKYGNPCIGLVEQVCMYHNQFISRILGDRTKESHEFRLNEAGLKMYWRMEQRCFKCHIGGDQTDLYPAFMERVPKLLKEFGFERR
jgi:hypothetical protein